MSQSRYRHCVGLCSLLVLAACSSPSGMDAPDPHLIQPVGLPSVPYARMIGAARYQSSTSYEEYGYQIESGNLWVTGRVAGSLVMVRKADGATLSLVDEPGEQGRTGTWWITPQGGATFSAAPQANFLNPDTVRGRLEQARLTTASDADGTYRIDMLAGYSKAAASWAVDPLAHALAQLETANLNLRNTQLSIARLHLAGIQIVDEDFGVLTPVLRRLPTLFAQGGSAFGADAIVAFSSGKTSSATAWASTPGRTVVNFVESPGAFRHEIAHDVGGNHCNDGSEANKGNYKFGYESGANSTALCGNKVPYYSSPALHDENGKPRGNAQTADMARLWTEQAQRMAAYAEPLEGERLILASVNGTADATLKIHTDNDSTALGVVVADTVTEGPRALANVDSGYTRLVAKLADKFGQTHDVVLRGQRINGCVTRGMEYYRGCGTGKREIDLKIALLEEDNPDLVGGMLTGVMQLRALDGNFSAWHLDVPVLLSVNRPPKAQLVLQGDSQNGTLSGSVKLPVPDNTYAVRAMSLAEGPVEIVSTGGTAILLKAMVSNTQGEQFPVSLLATRTVSNCQAVAIQVAAVCAAAAPDVTLQVSYEPYFNPSLPAGAYTGNIQLAAQKLDGHRATPLEVKLNFVRR